MVLRASIDLEIINHNPSILYKTCIDSPSHIPNAVASPDLRDVPNEFLIIRMVDGPGLMRASRWIPSIDNMVAVVIIIIFTNKLWYSNLRYFYSMEICYLLEIFIHE